MMNFLGMSFYCFKNGPFFQKNRVRSLSWQLWPRRCNWPGKTSAFWRMKNPGCITCCNMENPRWNPGQWEIPGGKVVKRLGSNKMDDTWGRSRCLTNSLAWDCLEKSSTVEHHMSLCFAGIVWNITQVKIQNLPPENDAIWVSKFLQPLN